MATLLIWCGVAVLGGLGAIAVRVVSVAVVQQEHGTGTHALNRASGDRVGAGPGGIPNSQRPTNRPLAHRARD